MRSARIFAYARSRRVALAALSAVVYHYRDQLFESIPEYGQR